MSISSARSQKVIHVRELLELGLFYMFNIFVFHDFSILGKWFLILRFEGVGSLILRVEVVRIEVEASLGVTSLVAFVQKALGFSPGDYFGVLTRWFRQRFFAPVSRTVLRIEI